jgi:hypothetical protein
MRLRPPSAGLSRPAGVLYARLDSNLRTQLAELETLCADRGSQARLSRLISGLASPHRGVVESALAELELAVLLRRAGFRVGFLPESQARTADLECHHGQERFFVEITSMVGSQAFRHSLAKKGFQGWKENAMEGLDSFLINRLLARISQKAKQLADYRAPVVLAMTMSDHDQPDHKAEARKPREEVDLRRLSGAVTVMLPLVPQVSAVLLSLWNVEPAPARSGVRLANVFIVERPRQQSAYPRVRLLILNPAARCPLKTTEIGPLKGLL